MRSVLSRAEERVVAAVAGVSLVIRALAFFHYRFDSDEPQHLHVAWGWTAGLLQYRDVFDNHAPLFHMLTAPLLRAVGERATVLFYMRAPMFLLWVVVLGGTFVVARRLYEVRVAVWSTLLLAIVPSFFLKSLEYRTDNLWNAFWMIAMVVLTGGALSSGRLFFTGLLLGLAMATSMKTSVLVITLIMAWAIADGLGKALAKAAPLLLGVLLPPTLIAIYFWYRGAWASLLYCVFTFNGEAAATWDPLAVWLRRAFWVPAMLVTIIMAWQFRSGREDAAARWRLFFGLATAIFCINLISFWVLLSPRDALPFLPFVVIFAVAAVERRAKRPAIAFALSSVVFFAGILYYSDGLKNHTREYTTMMSQVLRLTRPGEMLMDLKGETVYRPRPYYYIFEFIGRRVMRKHKIPDNVPESIVAKRCYVTQAVGPFFSSRTQQFLRENFLDMGRLRAAGRLIGDDGGFTIAVPGEYMIINHRGETSGTLDGTPYAGARRLEAGAHRFDRALAGEVVAVLWAPAFRRGFSPFNLQDREF